MKLNSFFLTATLGIGLAMSSCSDDNTPTTNGDNKHEQGNAYLSLTIQLPNQAMTKSRATEEGTEEESKINDVTILFFNKDFKDLEICYPLLDFHKQGNRVDIKPINIEKKDYDIVALINKPEKLNLDIITKKHQFEEAAQELESDHLKNNGFFMTNATGYKSITTANFHPTIESASYSPVFLKVERALAKVVVIATEVKTPANSKVDEITWALNVKNTTMYWMRKLTHKIDLTNSRGEMETEVDYNDTDREFLYAEDPNFYDHSSVHDFKYINDASPDEIVIDQNPGSENALYTLENTMEAEHQYRNVTTSVVVRLVYIPTELEEYEVRNDGYYIYNGGIIDFSDMKEYHNDRWTIPTSYYGLAELLDAYTGDIKEKSFEHIFEGNKLTFYKGGVCYYNVPIKHCSKQEPMNYGRYGVVRNNVYKLTINSIAGPGKIYPDEENWEDDENSFIGFNFEITPWFVREQPVDL